MAYIDYKNERPAFNSIHTPAADKVLADIDLLLSAGGYKEGDAITLGFQNFTNDLFIVSWWEPSDKPERGEFMYRYTNLQANTFERHQRFVDKATMTWAIKNLDYAFEKSLISVAWVDYKSIVRFKRGQRTSTPKKEK